MEVETPKQRCEAGSEAVVLIVLALPKNAFARRHRKGVANTLGITQG